LVIDGAKLPVNEVKWHTDGVKLPANEVRLHTIALKLLVLPML
jgi:hypothetical protein